MAFTESEFAIIEQNLKVLQNVDDPHPSNANVLHLHW